MNLRHLFTIVVVSLATRVAVAETFTIGPEDDWTVLESAEAGDIVEIAPGTYQFRVYLNNVGTADAPIVIRAQNPDDRPVWDLVGDGPDTLVDQWPGSYTAGDRHRGCWQVGGDGAFYEISGIVFQNCRAPSSAGVRMINSGPVTLRDCLFQFNTNGLTGASTDLIVEHSEFYENGKTITSGPATHHIYIFGGRFTLRYSYLHDGHEGQAFHVRARESVIEYNWISRPANYVGDIMSCEQFCGAEPHTQTMLVRGNVIVQGTPENQSQFFALYRDANANINATMDLTLAYNTIIGTPRNPGQTHVLVNLRNDTVSTFAHVNNNIIVDVGDIGEAAVPDGVNWALDGASNWVTTGTEHGDLTDTILGDDPGFVDRESLNFALTAGSAAVGAADDALEGTPDREYYRDETVSMMWRPRPSANDLGAFERGNAETPVGPYGVVPDPVDPSPDDAQLDSPPDEAPDAGGDVGADMVADEGGEPAADAVGGRGSNEVGCGCGLAGTRRASAWMWLPLFGVVWFGRRGRLG